MIAGPLFEPDRRHCFSLFAMTGAGLNRWVDRHFTPHMTLSYDRRIIEERVVETVSWPVNDLVLVYSLRGRGPGRNEHIHLARWRLR